MIRLRQDIFNAYGKQCACCGESQKEFLTIDHINGDGAKHRRERNGSNLYVWLRQNDYPEGFQTLCWNCNCAKHIYGICPHNKKE